MSNYWSNLINEKRIFQKTATGVLVTFLGLLLLVTIAAYSRTSGFTHQDMSEAQFIRQKAQTNPIAENHHDK